MNSNGTQPTALFRDQLPQLGGGLFLTDGGLETTLIFHDGLEVPEFAAFDLLKHEEGRSALRTYYRSYADIARRHGIGIVLETPTWRANADWGRKIGYGARGLARANHDSVTLIESIRGEYDDINVVISGCIGPQDDGYSPQGKLTVEQAEQYHAEQIHMFVATRADMVTALTMTYPEEAIGIARAARSVSMPVAIAFTVETDGHLPNGQTLRSAIEQVDAATDGAPIYYMINCAHPTHFTDVLEADEAWTQRIRGLRANASCMSHDELDVAEELDEGNPLELAGQYRVLLENQLRNMAVIGGCCGTDHRHIAAICEACMSVIGMAMTESA